MTRRKTGSGIRMKERLQKLLSAAGVCSRRAAEGYITAGRVTVNGETALLGQQADPETDDIRVDGVPLGREPEAVYLMLNKPRGYVTTVSDEQGRKTVMDLLTGVSTRVYPVGRLDRDSEGLLLLTNQGDLVNKIMRAGNMHEKEYLVTVNKPLTESFLRGMAGGVPLVELNATTRRCFVERIGKREFRIILTQGLNRQIRRMCEYFGYRVEKLVRVRIMNIEVGSLKSGTYRNVTEEEYHELLRLTADSSSDPVMPAKKTGEKKR